jgi:hypothetical protein
MAGRRGEAPVKAGGTNTHATKGKATNQGGGQDGKAAHRLAVVLRALELRADEPKLSQRQIYFRIKAEASNVAVGDRALLPWPSQPTFNEWVARADAIAASEGRRPSLTDYVTEKTGGKQAKPIDPIVLDLLREFVLVQGTQSATRLWEDACEHGAQEKVPAPSRYQVRKFLESMPIEEIAAARHGSAAANADAMLKADDPHGLSARGVVARRAPPPGVDSRRPPSVEQAGVGQAVGRAHRGQPQPGPRQLPHRRAVPREVRRQRLHCCRERLEALHTLRLETLHAPPRAWRCRSWPSFGEDRRGSLSHLEH